MFDDINYLEINTLDIWQYETKQYLRQRRTEAEILNFKEFYERFLIAKFRTGEISPICSSADQDKLYFEKSSTAYGFPKNIKEELQLNYFKINFKGIEIFITYDHDIVITKSEPDFQLWYVIKLRQFESSLNNLEEFISFHLTKNFTSDHRTYISFLQSIIDRYTSHQFPLEVLNKLKKYCQSHTTVSLKQEVIPSNYFLKKLQDNPNYCSSGDGVIILVDIHRRLKETGFIDTNSHINSFTKMLGNRKIKSNEKIIWSGKPIELKWFIQIMVSLKVLEEVDDIVKWEIGMRCFLLKKKTGVLVPIEKYTTIANSFTDNFNKHRKEELQNILNCLHKI